MLISTSYSIYLYLCMIIDNAVSDSDIRGLSAYDLRLSISHISVVSVLYKWSTGDLGPASQARRR